MFQLPALRRGDDSVVLVGVSLSSGTLVGSTVRCTIKRDPNDPDSAALVRLTTDDGSIQIVDATHIRLIFGHAATVALEPGPQYVDIQVVSSDGLVFTVDNLSDRVPVKKDITLTVP